MSMGGCRRLRRHRRHRRPCCDIAAISAPAAPAAPAAPLPGGGGRRRRRHGWRRWRRRRRGAAVAAAWVAAAAIGWRRAAWVAGGGEGGGMSGGPRGTGGRDTSSGHYSSTPPCPSTVRLACLAPYRLLVWARLARPLTRGPACRQGQAVGVAGRNAGWRAAACRAARRQASMPGGGATCRWRGGGAARRVGGPARRVAGGGMPGGEPQQWHFGSGGTGRRVGGRSHGRMLTTECIVTEHHQPAHSMHRYHPACGERVDAPCAFIQQ
jgi:hypothetical protein